MHLPDPKLQPEFYDYVVLKRTVALLLDLVPIGLISFFVLFVWLVFLNLIAVDAAFLLQGRFVAFLVLMVFLGYRTIMLASYGASLGMLVMALTWRNLNGDKPSAATAFRYSLIHLGQYVVLPVQFVSFVVMLVTPYRQGICDHVFGTTILNRSAAG
jgi:uncharacterized RDD family membrane protein YckC